MATARTSRAHGRASRLGAGVLLSLALLVAGCGDGEPDGPAGAGAEMVFVAAEGHGRLPVWVGIDRGVFAPYEFTAEFRSAETSAKALEAVAAGAAQAASVPLVALLQALAGGSEALLWVGCPVAAPGREALVARAGVKGFEDLKGLRIGLAPGSASDVTLRLLLRAHGLDPARDVTLVPLAPDTVAEGFRGGAVEAVALGDPGLAAAESVPGATVLGGTPTPSRRAPTAAPSRRTSSS